jgi:hypothetical protein
MPRRTQGVDEVGADEPVGTGNQKASHGLLSPPPPPPRALLGTKRSRATPTTRGIISP